MAEVGSSGSGGGRHLAVNLAILICLGLLGAVALVRPLRARWRVHAAVCRICGRHQTLLQVAVLISAVVLCAGAAVRGVASVTPTVICHSQVEESGAAVPEPLLPLASAEPPALVAARAVVTAPASGLALLGSWAVGLRDCAGPPLVVTFRWPSSASGGSMIGDVFVTWADRLDRPSGVLQERLVADDSGAPINRFGPNISTDRAAEERLGEHEVRHLDQWAVLSVLGGPAAFPVAYGADYLVFPYSRSHFERAAGLADGDYPEPDGYGPAPLWGPLIGVLVGLGVLLRHRIRMLWRLTPRRRRAFAAEPGRCLRHSRTSRLVPAAAADPRPR